MFRGRQPSFRQAGDGYRDAGNWKLASDAYRQHLREFPDDAAIWTQLGHVEKEARAFAEAAAAYEQAAAISQLDRDPLLHLAHMHRSTGQVAQALSAFARLYLLEPEAEVLAIIRELRSGVPSVLVGGDGSVVYVIEDLVEALRHGAPPTPLREAQIAIVKAVALGGGDNVHLAIQDDEDRTNRGFLLLDAASMHVALQDADDAAGARRSVILARLEACPLRLDIGATLVVPAALESATMTPGRYLVAKEAGCSLLLLVHGSTDCVHSRLPLVRRRFAEFSYLADAFLVGSVAAKHDLEQWQATADAPLRPVALIPLKQVSSGNEGVAAVHRAVRNAAALKTRPFAPIGLPPAMIFRLTDLADTSLAESYAARPLGLALTNDFEEADRGGARMRGMVGTLRFDTGRYGGVGIVVYLALAVDQAADGDRVAMTAGSVRDGALRWRRVTTGTNLFRFEGYVAPDGGCELTLFRDSDQHGGVPPDEVSSLFLVEFGYALTEDRPAARALRERFLF